MSHASPVVYRMNNPDDAVIDVTVLGTPIPVAHSTVSQKNKQRTFLLTNPNAIPKALPVLEQSTITVPESPRSKETTSLPHSYPPAKDSPSILNIESMKGLSGSVLDESLQARTRQFSLAKGHGATYSLTRRPDAPETNGPGASFEETEAETRQIQFDEAELKCLEDAFSDLDCAMSEVEATLPTKACATLSAKRLHSNRERSASHYDDSATTISSLHSALNSDRTDKTASDRDTGVLDAVCAPEQTSKSGISDNMNVQEVPVETHPLSKSRSYLQIETRTNHNPTPVQQSTVPTTDHGLPNDENSPPFVPNDDTAASTSGTSGYAAATEAVTSSGVADANVRNGNTGTKISCEDQRIISDVPHSASKLSLASFTSVTEASLSSQTKTSRWDSKSVSSLPPPVSRSGKTTNNQSVTAPSRSVVAKMHTSNRDRSPEASVCSESPTDEYGGGTVEQSTTLVSCLHMSDVDGLLDFVGTNQPVFNRETFPDDTEHSNAKPLRGQLNRQTVAHLRAIRPRFSQSDRIQLAATPAIQVAKTVSPHGCSASKTTVLEPQDENLPPGLPRRGAVAAAAVTTSQTSTHKSFVAPERKEPSRRNSEPRPVLQERPTSNELTLTHPRTSSLSEQESKLRSNPTSTAPAVSPLLSNADCLFWCGSVCGQIQYQDMLIKHQLEEPVTVQLAISPGSDVFKLVDELGYLLSGPQTVQLPPGLEYTVKIAYVARHPLTWDTGQLQLSIGETPESVWKVRLVGYSNSSQLECSCCKRLSAEVYWTTAVKVSYPSNQCVRLSQAPSTPPTPRLLASPSTSTHLDHSANDVSITSVVLTNFGTRVAWVWARVEPLSVDDKICELAEPDSSIESANMTSISIEPCRVVIGPQHSQQVIITMPSEVKACRVVFHYGDEVLRHQVRQHFILPRSVISNPGNDERSSQRKARKQIRIVDLMCSFANETPFPITEVPSQLKKPIRLEDWRRALSHQLRLRQYLVLNVYAVTSEFASSQGKKSLGQFSRTSRRSDSPTTLASIHVEADAFNTHAKSTGSCELGEETLEHANNSCCERITSTSSTPVPLPGAGESYSRTIRPELNPAKLLTFSNCFPTEMSSGHFSLSISDVTLWSSEYECKVVWSTFPVGDVRRRVYISTVGSCPSSCDTQDCIFECVGSTEMTTSVPDAPGARSTSGFGALPLNQTTAHRRPNALRIPFVFRPRDAHTSYTQDWCITVWMQPTRATDLHVTESRTTVDLTDRRTSQFVFPITLKGRSRGPDSRSVVSVETGRSSTEKTTCSDTLRSTHGASRTNQLITTHHSATRFSRSGRVMELGPLRIAGLPVLFKSVDRYSDSPSQTHELELINLKHPGLLFVKLDLPKAPFSVDKPQETRFRILPNRCVRLVLSYRPTEPGPSQSCLGFEVIPLPSTSETDRSADPDLYKAELPLFGVMN
ncbi:hypothetical protein D915_007169 [Fasciola hepatica]|uniref:Cep192/Spd-2-like domain-containing protein n=1 Tax=Fasciola hepatica TaxID=6192 RepID=A0A4E0R4M2_FASHE|nr:hypothetical protein D915_007169 [Fasciola hepatica]